MAVINTNVKSLMAQDALQINNRKLSTTMQRLSTGSRINSASDDAAGLSISTRMDSQIKGLNMAIKNANDAISVTQTAEGAMDEVTNILQRMRELAVQSANDTNSAEDRKFLNQEVEQLSSEIDRIASTTQFNGINVLDGTFAKKVFQIGANQGQTMNLSIGSMSSKVLGVAAPMMSQAPDGTQAANPIGGAKVTGVASTPTVVSLEFDPASSSDATYAFHLQDSVSGISAEITTSTVDMTNQLSKDAFVDKINLALAEAQANTSITSSAAGSAVIDLTSPDNFAKVKFSVSVDNGEAVNIDLTQRLLSAHGGSASVVTLADVTAELNSELQLAFDSSISATASGAGGLKLEDKQGRRIEISQGAGNGYLFGTDVANGGSLLARETTRNPMSVAWSGNNLMVTNSSGGKISLDTFVASVGNKVVFNVVDDAQVDGLNEPVLLGSSTVTASTMDAVTFKGKTESSSMSIRFSDLIGTDGSSSAGSKYSFKLTNGAGDVYADFTASAGSALNVSESRTDREANIVKDIKAALASGISGLKSSDSTMNASEFEVVANGDTITITNKEGRALAIENFSSNSGYMIATPGNEPQTSTVVADRNAYYSETRVRLNTGIFGSDYATASASGEFKLTIDGIAASSTSMFMNGSAGLSSTQLASGGAFAAAVEDAISAAVVALGTTGVNQTTSNIKVSYDATSGDLVIRDAGGRSVGFGFGANNPLAATGNLMTQDFVVGNANKGFGVNVTSGTAQGDVVESTKVTMSLSADDAKFNFKLNGVALDTSEVQWHANEDFATSTLKTKLDAMVNTINSVHPNDVVQYTVSGRDITFYQRDGGALAISDFKTAATHPDLTATLKPAEGQGTGKTLSYGIHTTAQAATAAGTLAVATTATLNLQADDVYSMTLSDGAKSYKMTNTTLDVNDSDSVNNFVKKLENSLSGSSISVSMDTNGNVAFKRADGGDLILTEFTSATGKSATWIPGAGLGDSVSLAGNGAINPADGTVSGGSTTAATGGSSVAQISIATQDGASKALSVIDKAISYVNTERSKLGAVENRLTHTIDNLANVVTNTSASKSRIKDTDYASETAELARTQIIQQAATAMLAQANQQPQSVLSLLK
jgi:flagellin